VVIRFLIEGRMPAKHKKKNGHSAYRKEEKQKRWRKKRKLRPSAPSKEKGVTRGREEGKLPQKRELTASTISGKKITKKETGDRLSTTWGHDSSPGNERERKLWPTSEEEKWRTSITFSHICERKGDPKTKKETGASIFQKK